MHKFNIKNLEKLDNPIRRQSMPPIETLKNFKLLQEFHGILSNFLIQIIAFTLSLLFKLRFFHTSLLSLPLSTKV